MIIVDSQVHIWANDSPTRPWPASGTRGRTSTPHRPTGFTQQDLLKEMDGAGVRGAVIVPPSWEGDYNDLALDAARSHPNRFVVFGRMDPEAQDGKASLASWKPRGLTGIRLLFTRHSPWIKEGEHYWLWEAAAHHGIPISFFPIGDYLPLIGQIARSHPDLRVSIDHLACNHGMDAKAFENIDSLLALARFPNVAVKASAVPCYSSEQYPYSGLHDSLHRVVDSFGPKRVFWGSDLTRLPCSYIQCVTLFTEELPWLGGSDLDWIMGRAICEWLRWPIVTPADDKNLQ